MYNWKIGQDIVCIKTHEQGVIKEGEVFTIKGIRTDFCSCSFIHFNVGIGTTNKREVCTFCGFHAVATNIYWLSETRFAPLDTLTDISEIEEILSQPIESLFKI